MSQNNINRTQLDYKSMKEPQDAYFENVSILYKNFAGRQTQFNSAGARNFSIEILNLGVAQDLYNKGYKIKDIRLKEGEEPSQQRWQMPVKVSYNGWSVPQVYRVMKDLQTGEDSGLLPLTESTISVLDSTPILSADILIRGAFFDYLGNVGFQTYLKTIYVRADEHVIDARYMHLPPVGR